MIDAVRGKISTARQTGEDTGKTMVEGAVAGAENAKSGAKAS